MSTLEPDKPAGGDAAAGNNLFQLFKRILGLRSQQGDALSTPDEKEPEGEKAPLSVCAIILILLVAAIWAWVGSYGLLSWDAHTYYDQWESKSWGENYKLEPVLFWVTSIVHPSSFASYIFFYIAISLSILLLSLRRMHYAVLDQFITVFFLSCSFYGLHFMVTFQRQFLGLVFFICALSGGPTSILARLASVFSQLFTFTLHVFWWMGRLPVWLAALASCTFVVVSGGVLNMIVPEKAEQYGAVGADAPLHLAIKQSLTILFCIALLATLRKGRSVLRTGTIMYITLSIPAIVWPFYAGVFVRLDYFFFPVLVALAPQYVRSERVVASRLLIVSFCILGFYVWMKSNMACSVMRYCQ